MQINVLLRSISFAFLLLIALNLRAAESPQVALMCKEVCTDDFLVQFTSTHKNTFYDGKQFVFYANPSFLYMFEAESVAAAGLVMGAMMVHLSYDEREKDTWFLFLVGVVVSIVGAGGAKLFFDAVSMRIKQIEYIKFDAIGIYKWGQLQAKWANVSSIYLSKTYYNDNPIKRASFSDQRLNDLFEIKDTDKFLPVAFDDFLSISEYYLNKFNPKPIGV
jgi:hypothetical protein